MKSFKDIIKTIVYFFLSFFPSRGAVILMYHSVGDNGAFFTVSARKFEKQMAYLRDKRFNVISLPSLVHIQKKQEPIPAKTVVITIDDGYEDNYFNLFPILKRHNLPASIFIVTGDMGGARTISDGRVLKMLRPEHIKEMATSGLVEFYPHTHTHPRLDQLNPESARNEIIGSKKIVQEIIGREPNVFAYPYGRFNDKIIEILEAENFETALTVNPGTIRPSDDSFQLKRNSIDSAVNFTVFKAIARRGRI